MLTPTRIDRQQSTRRERVDPRLPQASPGEHLRLVADHVGLQHLVHPTLGRKTPQPENGAPTMFPKSFGKKLLAIANCTMLTSFSPAGASPPCVVLVLGLVATPPAARPALQATTQDAGRRPARTYHCTPETPTTFRAASPPLQRPPGHHQAYPVLSSSAMVSISGLRPGTPGHRLEEEANELLHQGR